MSEESTKALEAVAQRIHETADLTPDGQTLALALLSIADPLYKIRDELKGLRERITAVTTADGE